MIRRQAMKKILLKILGIVTGVFGLTFIIYIFNPDMKFMAYVFEPILQKIYDNRKRKYYV